MCFGVSITPRMTTRVESTRAHEIFLRFHDLTEHATPHSRMWRIICKPNHLRKGGKHSLPTRASPHPAKYALFAGLLACAEAIACRLQLPREEARAATAGHTHTYKAVLEKNRICLGFGVKMGFQAREGPIWCASSILIPIITPGILSCLFSKL